VIPFILEAGKGADGLMLEEMRVLPVMSKVTLSAPNLAPTVRYVLFEAHSFLYNLTLSYNQTLTPSTHINGTNLGLLVKPKGQMAQITLQNFNIESNVTVLLVAKALSNTGRNFLLFLGDVKLNECRNVFLKLFILAV
jgi:hypothetical protein